jgi:hypothetical protein
MESLFHGAKDYFERAEQCEKITFKLNKKHALENW